jgi:FMN-dependent NADH-azoreductase
MPKILCLQASPRADKSASIAVANAFVEAYRETHPDTTAGTVNLFEVDLPAFDKIASQGKYAILHGQEAPLKVKQAFQKVVKVIEAFKDNDLYVFAVPMWNFGIPYPLKHYLDLIIQPTYTFQVGAKGYEGLLTGKKAFCAYARGGDYEGNDSVDFQKRYLDLALGFMGIKDVKSVVVQPTLASGAETAQAKLEAGIAKARELAKGYLALSEIRIRGFHIGMYSPPGSIRAASRKPCARPCCRRYMAITGISR